MDGADPSTPWSPSALCSTGDDFSAKYTLSYLDSFLPAYQLVNQSTISSVTDRYRAIRFAADASLARTASGAGWSDALRKQLTDTYRGASGAHSRQHDEMPVGSASEHSEDVGPSPSTSRMARPWDDCETCGLAEKEGCRANLSGDSAEDETGMAPEEKEIDGSPGKTRTKRSTRAPSASRPSVLRALLRRSRSKKCLTKRPRKQKISVRRVKTLSKSRRRSSFKQPRPVRAEMRQDSDQMVQTSIFTLQQLIPGGAGMDEAVLLNEAADFVTFLELQVQALQSVACAVDEQFRVNVSLD